MAINALAALVVSLEANIAKFTTDMKTAADVAQNTFALIESAAAGAKKGLLGIAEGLAGGISVGTFVHLIDSTIEATAELDKMAQRTGATVEALSGLRATARIVGTDMSVVEKGIGLLDKAMFSAATTGGKAKIAFDTLGVSVKDSAGNLRNTDDVLLEIAKSFAAMENSSTKSALAMSLLGRAGRELIPVLNELGEQGDYQGKVTTRQAEIAKDLEENFRRLGAGGREMKQIFVNEITPAIDALVKSFLAFLNQTGGLRDTVRGLAADGSLQSWARQVGYALAAMADAFHDAWEDFKGLAQFLGSFVSIAAGVVFQIKGIDLALQGKFTQGFDMVRQGMDKVKEGYSAMSASLSKPIAQSTQFRDNYLKALIEIDTAQEKLRNRPPAPEGGVGKDRVDPLTAFVSRLKEEAALQKEAENAQLTEAKQFQQEMIAIDNLAFQAREVSQVEFLEMKRSRDQQYAASSEAIAQQAVTDAQKRIDDLAAFANAQTLTNKQAEAAVKARAAADLELAKAQDALAKVTKAANIEDLKDSGDILHAREAIVDAVRKQAQAFDDFLTKLQEEDTERQFQLELLGKTADEVAILTAAHGAELEVRRKQLELERLLNEEWAKGAQARPEVINALYLQLARLPEIYDKTRTSVVATKQATIDYQNSFEGGWKRAFDSYMQSISAASIAQQAFNTLTQGLETLIVGALSHAKNAWKNFTDSILKMLEQIAAKIAVSGLLQLFGLGSGGLNFSFGGVAAGGGGAAGGLGGLGNILGGGKDLVSLLTGNASLASFGTSLGTTLGLSAGPAFGAGLEAGAGAAAGFGAEVAGAAGAAGAFGAAVATAIPVIGLFAAGGLLLKGYLDSKKGGPMTREFGTSGADISTFGDFSTLHKLVGTDAVATAAYNNAATTAQGTYDGIVRAFGGTPGAAQFAIYTSQDLKGKAPSQGDVRATVSGQAAYTSVFDVAHGDTAGLQARTQLEVQRAILAALQDTNFPRYLADIFKSVDTATATEAQIANITATAVAIKQVVDTIPELADAFTQLDAASTLALVDLVGGVEKFNSSMSFLATNFETSGDKAAKAQQALVASFTDLGLQVPKTHAEFLKLLSSFDLTTESGRKLYAAVLALSGAFVEVKGTADQAAEALKTSINSLREAKGSFTGVQQAGTSSQDQLNSLLTTFIADKPWAQGLGSGTLIDSLSQILESDFAQYSAADQALIIQIINLAATIKSGATTIADSNQSLVDATNAARVAAEQQLSSNISDALSIGQQQVALFGTIAGQSGGDFGQQIALQLQYIDTAIASLKTELQHVTPSTNYGQALNAELKSLQAAEKPLVQQLQFFVSLSSRYGSAIAEQLVKLTQTYGTQADQLRNNAGALAILNQSFEDNWNKIISGTAAGVTGVQDQLKKLQQSILDYVDSLRISDISPLTPAQKLAEAQRQYESDLAKASTGDQKALGDVTGSADAFLKLARDFYASSSAYTNIFNQVTGQLTTLGTADLSAVSVPMNAADQALLSTLPVGSKLMSAADLQAVIALFTGLGEKDVATILKTIVPAPTPVPTVTTAPAPTVATAPTVLTVPITTPAPGTNVFPTAPIATPTPTVFPTAPIATPTLDSWTKFWQQISPLASTATVPATTTTGPEALSMQDLVAAVVLSIAQDADKNADKIGDKIDQSKNAIVEAITVGSK